MLLLLALAGCRAEPPPDLAWVPVHHLAGQHVDAMGRTRAARATLLDDTRPVLQEPGLLTLRARAVPVDGSGRLRVTLSLPGRPGELAGVVGAVQVRKKGRREVLDAAFHPLARRPDGSPALRIDVALPAVFADEERVGLLVSGLGVPEPAEQRQESPPFEVPPGARLDFAVGLAEAGATGGGAEFELSACDERGGCESLFRERLDAAAQPGWHERSLSLAGRAGQRLSLRFETRRPADAPALPVWGNPRVLAPAPRPADAHNVVLISIDTLRADHLGAYGHPRDTSPFLDAELAARGTLFENVSAATPVTAPSHMTMLTALQPSAHGVTDGLKVLPLGIRTVPEHARDAGFATAAFTENGWVGVLQGFSRGFDRFVENKSAEIMVPEGEVDVTFAQARAWIEAHRDQRFFLFVHTYQVHSPYAAPERYAGLFPAPPAEDAEAQRALALAAEYDREIRFVDDELRELVGTVEALGLGGRTVFVLTSDHGEAFAEHGLLYHGGHLYEEAVRIPLVLRGPGIPAGRRVAEPVAQADLMPTLLELLGLPVPEGLPARSLLPLLRDPARDAGPDGGAPVFTEAWVRFQPGLGRSARAFEPPSYGVRVGQTKLLRETRDGALHYELYDLAADPGEQRDLSGERPERTRELAALIERYVRERAAEQARYRDGGETPEPEPAPELDPEREEKLRALGYIE